MPKIGKKRLTVVFLSIPSDVTRYPVPHGDRFNIRELCDHHLVMLKVVCKFIVVFSNEVDRDAFYVGGSDLSHIMLTINATTNVDWLF